MWRKGDKTRKPFQASLQQQYKQMQNPNVTLSNSNSSLKPSESQDDCGDPDGKAESVLDNEQASPDKQFQAAINSTQSGPTEFSQPTSPTEEEKENPREPAVSVAVKTEEPESTPAV